MRLGGPFAFRFLHLMIPRRQENISFEVVRGALLDMEFKKITQDGFVRGTLQTISTKIKQRGKPTYLSRGDWSPFLSDNGVNKPNPPSHIARALDIPDSDRSNNYIKLEFFQK
jgi:hypothetical protein